MINKDNDLADKVRKLLESRINSKKTQQTKKKKTPSYYSPKNKISKPSFRTYFIAGSIIVGSLIGTYFGLKERKENQQIQPTNESNNYTHKINNSNTINSINSQININGSMVNSSQGGVYINGQYITRELYPRDTIFKTGDRYTKIKYNGNNMSVTTSNKK